MDNAPFHRRSAARSAWANWLCVQSAPFRRAAHVALMVVGLLALSAMTPLQGIQTQKRTLGLPPLPIPPDNVQTAEKVELGRTLFNNRRLSGDGSVSCASCHQPERAFTDGCRVSVGIGGRTGTRNAPTLLNAAFLDTQFWDGRRASLEEQVKDPLLHPAEHGIATPEGLLKIIRNDPDYVEQFARAFAVDAADVSFDDVAKAIAAFERTLIAGDSPFDRYYYAGDKAGLSRSAVRGLELFRGRAQCATCHVIGERHALFTDQKFHSLGVGRKRIEPRLAEMSVRIARMDAAARARATLSEPEMSEFGRFLVTLKPVDIGRFKTPSLRNVALTAPYMHDGSVANLEEAVELEIYYRGIKAGRPLILTAQEKADLVDFLRSLTSSMISTPARPNECQTRGAAK